MSCREETDLLGKITLTENVFYGIQTQRAVDNFSITNSTISGFPTLITSLAMIKKAAAVTNHELGLLNESKMLAISKACEEVIAGKYREAFVVDVIQGGAGTSTNMNMNEVLANIGLLHLGYNKGQYQYLHPNDDVNMSQSTNDVYPSAARLAILLSGDELKIHLQSLIQTIHAKSEEFTHIIKMGRTQLQDAVPMSLGQEFSAFADTLSEEIQSIEFAENLMREINLGGTAIGTSINSSKEFVGKVVANLVTISGVSLKRSKNLIEATSDTGAFVFYSGVLKRLAVKLSKICNDLRLLSSGPRTGLGEITLPAVQPGSSIMPGKVNPVIPEAVNQTAYQVIGNDLTVTLASESGQLQLNAMGPVIVFNILNSLHMLSSACRMLDKKCVGGIQANEHICRDNVENSVGTVTALVPEIGYANASKVARIALTENKTLREVVLAHQLLDETRLNETLNPFKLANME